MPEPRVWTVVAGVCTALLIVYAATERADVPLLSDPSASLDAASVTVAAIGVALLVADAVLPIPASVVMVALGATFGFVGGFVISLVGSIGGFCLGFLIGRRSSRSITSAFAGGEHRRAARFVARWGVLSIVVSRPLPLIAETIAVMSGVLGMRAVPALAAAAAGCTGPAAAYAYAGSSGAATAGGGVVFALVAIAACLCWVAGRRLTTRDTVR